MDNRRRNITKPISTTGKYSANNVSTTNDNFKLEKTKQRFFLNRNDKNVDLLYVNKEGEIPYIPNRMFPPVNFDDAIDILYSRDDLTEVDKERFIMEFKKKFDSLKNQIDDMSRLILSIVKDM